MPWHIASAQSHGTSGWLFQDRIAIWECGEGSYGVAVFDGHGERSEAVEHCATRVASLLADCTFQNAAERITGACSTLAKEVREKEDGTTCSLALLFPDGSVVCAVIGDSPIFGLRSKDTIVVSEEHNIRSNRAEADAAEARGGIIKNGYLYAKHHNHGIQLGRSLGDSLVSNVLSVEPSIASTRIEPGYFLCVASDGVVDLSWEGANALQVKEVIDALEEGESAEHVIGSMRENWKKTDDMSLIVCRYT